MRFLISIAVFLLSVFNSVQAQPDSLWSRTYGGQHEEQCLSLLQTEDGGYLLSGWTKSFGAGSNDFYLVKTDGNGEEQWAQTYGGEAQEELFDAIQTDDGGFFLGGSVRENTENSCWDIFVVKTDNAGEEEWTQRLGGDRDDECHSVMQLDDGSYVIAGFTCSFGAGGADYYLARLSSEGETVWTQTFGSEEEENCRVFVRTEDGDFILAGTRGAWMDPEELNSCIWLVRADENGELVSSQLIESEEGEFQVIFSIIPTLNSGFALAGAVGSLENDVMEMDMLMISFNQQDEMWSRRFESENPQWCNSLLQVNDCGFILAGVTATGFGEETGATLGGDFYLIRLNSDGDELWSRIIGGELSQVCNSVVSTPDGGYALAGEAGPNVDEEEVDKDILLIKTDADPVSVPDPGIVFHPSDFIMLDSYPNPFN